MSEAMNLQDAVTVCDLFDRATAASLASPLRSGSLIELPAAGRLTVAGDIHDSRVNLDKVLKLARLDAGDERHVVLQELLHGPRLINGMDFSYRTLARAAMLQIERPAQVHVLLSNHELAQVLGEGILKDAVNQIAACDAGMDYVFGDSAGDVKRAMAGYVRALPLAVRCANGVMVSHSLPPPRAGAGFDRGVLTRPLTEADYQRPLGPAYLMVWGRGATQAWLDELAAAWGVRLFVIGHERAEMGCEDRCDTMIVVNSDHDHAAALPIDLSRDYERDELLDEAVPLNAI